MVGLISSVFNVFQESKDVQALNDSSRRALASMSRLLKTALHFDNSYCDVNKIRFWADIDNDQHPTADPLTWLGIDKYKLGETVVLRKENNSVTMDVTQPLSEGSKVSSAKLGSYASDLKFFYFQPGIMPGGLDPYNPTLGIPASGDYNGQASMIRVVLKMSKGKIHRSYYQDVFLRIIQRRPDY